METGTTHDALERALLKHQRFEPALIRRLQQQFPIEPAWLTAPRHVTCERHGGPFFPHIEPYFNPDGSTLCPYCHGPTELELSFLAIAKAAEDAAIALSPKLGIHQTEFGPAYVGGEIQVMVIKPQLRYYCFIRAAVPLGVRSAPSGRYGIVWCGLALSDPRNIGSRYYLFPWRAELAEGLKGGLVCLQYDDEFHDGTKRAGYGALNMKFIETPASYDTWGNPYSPPKNFFQRVRRLYTGLVRLSHGQR